MSSNKGTGEKGNGKFVYSSPEEEETSHDKRVEKTKSMDEHIKNLKERTATRFIHIKVNGTVYTSVADAAKCIGISQQQLRKHHKKLLASSFSEINAEVMVKKTITLQKIK